MLRSKFKSAIKSDYKKLLEIKDLAQEVKKQDDDLWEVNSDLENWEKPL